MTPGERIHERRQKLGLTQEQLGRKARPKVAREAISKIESGKVGVGADVGRRLAHALRLNGETVDDVLREILSPPRLAGSNGSRSWRRIFAFFESG